MTTQCFVVRGALSPDPPFSAGGGSRLRRVRLVVLAAAAWLCLAGAASARLDEAPLETRLARALKEDGVSLTGTGAIALELESGALVYEQNGAKALRPASTEKLTVALTALDELGPGFRIETVALGVGGRDGEVWRGDLVLKGYGDPSLHADDLARLAARIRALGIRRISGRVLGDESYFDEERTAPGWKASFYKLECPPLSALVVDRAWLDGHTADEPVVAAAVAFRRALGKAGVRVSGKAAEGIAGAGAVELGRVSSPPLRRLVAWMDTESDNFVAEMLLKLLAAEEVGQGTTAAGAAIVRRELEGRGVPLAGVRIVDGSGLSRLDRLTARALAAVLRSGWGDARVSAAFVGSLAVAGVSGTLEDRMEKAPARGRVRAKTGTTNEASALAGFAGEGYVFAVVMNGDPVAYSAARDAQDRFATILAKSL